jgi:hypothetical protein
MKILKSIFLSLVIAASMEAVSIPVFAKDSPTPLELIELINEDIMKAFNSNRDAAAKLTFNALRYTEEIPITDKVVRIHIYNATKLLKEAYSDLNNGATARANYELKKAYEEINSLKSHL